MPLTMQSKGTHATHSNVGWSLASEDTRSQFVQAKFPCDKLHLPTIIGARSPNANDSGVNDTIKAAESFDIFLADQTLCTALRIHPEEHESALYSATRSKGVTWPWFVACRSVFLSRDTLSLYNLGMYSTNYTT